METTQTLDEKKTRTWMWAGLLVLVALQIHFVREMLAALMLITVAFAVFATIAFASQGGDVGIRKSLIQAVERDKSSALQPIHLSLFRPCLNPPTPGLQPPDEPGAFLIAE
jgi:hypothetical protein